MDPPADDTVPIESSSVSIGSFNYTVTVRPECTSNAECAGEDGNEIGGPARRRRHVYDNNTSSDTPLITPRHRRSVLGGGAYTLPNARSTVFSVGYIFRRSTELTIQGKQPGQPVLVVVCPFLTFADARSVTIRNLDITCRSSAQSLTGPAILFSGVTETVITAASLSFAGYVRSGIVILGGNFAQGVIPPTTSVNLDKSVFKSLSFSAASAYRAPKELSIGNYYGTIDVSGLAKYTRLLVQPVLDPTTQTASALVYNTANGVRGGLYIVNLTAYSNINGIDYIISVDDPGAFGVSALTTTIVEEYILHIALVYAAVVTLVVVFGHQGDMYYFFFLLKIKQD